MEALAPGDLFFLRKRNQVVFKLNRSKQSHRVLGDNGVDRQIPKNPPQLSRLST